MGRKIAAHSRKSYGRPRAQVEEEIRAAWGLMEKDEEEENEDDDGEKDILSQLMDDEGRDKSGD
jgi:hypothetical protein